MPSPSEHSYLVANLPKQQPVFPAPKPVFPPLQQSVPKGQAILAPTGSCCEFHPTNSQQKSALLLAQSDTLWDDLVEI
jgi:hypothetical protein